MLTGRNRIFVILLSVFCLFSSALAASEIKEPYTITVLGDPHLPGKNIKAKEKLIETLNTWKDTDLVVAVGDVCETTGTSEEYKFAKEYFSKLKKPLSLINGNHDYVFSKSDGSWHPEMAPTRERSEKLNRFMQTFDMKELYYSKIVGNYHLIFLSLDSLDTKYYAELSEKQLQWFDWQLYQHKNKPTIVFCHAPLWWKILTKIKPGISNFTIQPMDAIKAILKKHKQVFMWVAGHVHMGAENKYSRGFLNVYNRRIFNINNCDLNGRSILEGIKMNLVEHDNLWTKNLELYSDKVVVKTFDHKANKVIHQQDIKLPKFLR
ncbi:MAG: metallophosphoesterase [Candidatus Riflebacteria bacterium]|nr:metallophosphoesterase [Candidatus Riflebacteria bacterium]